MGLVSFDDFRLFVLSLFVCLFACWTFHIFLFKRATSGGFIVGF